MSFINRIIGDLRDKRALALAAAGLLAALIAVPVLLSKGSSSPAVIAQTPAIGQTAPSGLPVVNAVSSPAGGALAGPSHDPFAQPKGTSTTTSSGTTPSSGSSGTTGTGTTPSSGTSAAGTGTSTGGAPSTTPTATIPTGTPTPAPTGLTSTQSYEVKLAITNSAGGLDTIDPLERLSVLPSKQQPLLVELGVLKGGDRVLFALEPGAEVSGGTCIPGPIDCEIVSLAQDQTVTLSEQTAERHTDRRALRGHRHHRRRSLLGRGRQRGSQRLLGRRTASARTNPLQARSHCSDTSRAWARLSMNATWESANASPCIDRLDTRGLDGCGR